MVADDHFGLPEPAEPLRTLGRRQYAFWILQQLVPDTAVSNLSSAFRTTRPLRWWPLHAAINHLIGRHPALRTRFPAAGGVPVRHVSAAADVQLTVDVGAATETSLPELLHQSARKPFDLGADLPLRLWLFNLPDGGSAVLLVVHHAVVDAASIALLLDELTRAYDGIADGSGIPQALRPELPSTAEPPVRPEDQQYWVEHLRGLDVAQTALPWARPSPTHPTFAGRTMITSLAPETVAAVADLRRALGATENLILLTAFYLSLFRHGAGPDLVVGVPVTARRAGAGTGANAGIGFAVSTMPLRVVLDPKASFVELTREVRGVFLNGAQHASVSVEEVLADVGHHSANWWAPLFRHMYNYRSGDETGVRIAGEQPAFLDMFRDESRLDIQLVVIGGRPEPMLITNYSTEIHDEVGVALLLRRMEALLCSAAEEPDRPIGELVMATADERAVVAATNDTVRHGRPDRTVVDRFWSIVDSDPATVAIVDGDRTLSYGELGAEVRRVGARLRADGVVAGDVVALALPRGAAMAVAVLGVLAVGAAYLPLDPEHPKQRRATQLADARARLVVTESGSEDCAGVPALSWSELAGAGRPGVDVGWARLGWDTPANVIYTSGSTGAPRGVVVSHRNLANVVSDFADRLGLADGGAVLWSTTTAFDISGLELFLPLTTGGTVVVAGHRAQTRPRELLELVVKHDVAVVQGTPTFWRLAVAEVADELRGRTVLCGGEPMPATLARDLLGTGCRLFNVYGPTETTIWSTVAELGGDTAADLTDPVPVGRPIANTRVFVADRHGAELATGLLGELCIAGAGVSAGYLRRPEQTAERFAVSPVWGRYYRTGDLARWRADGVLELFGRDDRQVKVRGHRIELPEIESVLRGADEVIDAAVVVVGDPQRDAELRAFVRPTPGVAVAGLPDRLWPVLRERLPAAALPSRLTVLAEFPVTPNGKVDHAALRILDVTAATSGPADPSAGTDPAPELTRQLLELWRSTLGRPALGERDHFFLNGGHSLIAALLADRISEATGRDTPVRLIFDHPTARQLSAHLAGR
jgi:amino acid adenylation domain-containing protein